MPNSIDNRIVEMQFDNKNFEKNISQSIKSLQQLDDALELKDAAKGFENMEKAANSIDLSKLMNAADIIEKRFSMVGIAGAAFIQRGVNGVINLVGKLGSTVVNLAKTGGINRALNLEHANFMLEGILKDSKKVEEIMTGPVNNAVTGTAYGLDSSAKAASQFVAAGVTDLKKLETALTGISGVAAISGASYDEIAHVFNKVASRGKVMGDTIQELSTRGIAAQEELAKYLHKTVSEVQEMQKKGQISFEAFSQAMYDAFAAQAKKANETFTGAMSNVKAALSRIGAKIATPGIEEARKVLVDLIGVINKVNEVLSSELIVNVNNLISRAALLIRNAVTSRKFIVLIEKAVKNLSDGFGLVMNYIRPIKEAFRAIFPGSLIDRLISFNDGLSGIIEKLRLTGEKAAGIKFTLQGLFAIFDIALNIVKQIFGILLPGISGVYNSTDSLSTKILKLTGFVGFLLTKFDKWLKQNNIFTIGLNKLNSALGLTGTKALTVSNIITKAITVIGNVLKGVVSVFGLVAGSVIMFVKTVYDLPIVQTIINDIKNAIIRLGQIAVPIMATLAESFLSMLDSIVKFGEGGYITKGLEKLNDALNNVYWGAKNAFAGFKSFLGLFNKNANVGANIEKISVSYEKLAANTENLGLSLNGQTSTLTKFADAETTMADTTEKAATNINKSLIDLNNTGHLFAIGFSASLISAGVNIGRAFRHIGSLARNLKWTTWSIASFFTQLNLNLRVKTLLAFASCIVILAGALGLLTKLDTVKLLGTATAMAIITAAMVSLSKFIATADAVSYYKFLQASAGMVNVSVALLALSFALKVLSNAIHSVSDFVSMLGGVLVIIILMASICTALTLVSNLQKGSIKGTLAMVVIAGSINLLMHSLEKMQNLNLKKIEQSIPLMLKIISGLVTISLALSITLSPFGGLSFLGVVAGILMLFEGLSKLQSVDNKVVTQVEFIIDRLVLGLQHIIGSLIILEALNAAEAMFYWLPTIGNKITRGIRGMFAVAQKGIRYIGVAAIIISIAGAIKMVGDTLIELSTLEIEQILKGSAMVIMLSMVVAHVAAKVIEMASFVLAAGASAKSLGIGFAGVGAAVLSIALSIKLLSNMGDEFIKGLGYTVVILIALTAVIGAIGKITKYNADIKIGIGVFLGIAILLGMVVGAITIVGLTPWEIFIPAFASVIAILSILGLVILAITKIGESSKLAFISILSLAALFGVLGGVMYMLKDLTTANVFANAAVLELAVVGLAGIAYALGTDKIKQYAITGVVVLGALSILMAGLAGIGKILESINPKKMLKSMEYIGVAVLILSVAMGVLGGLAALSGGIGLAVMGAGLLVLAALAVVLKMFASAALPFGEAAKMVGEGAINIAKGFAEIQNMDLEAMLNNIVLLANAFTNLGNAAEPLTLFSDALTGTIPKLEAVGNAATIFASGVASIQSINVMEVSNQFNELATAIKSVNDNALDFLKFAGIAAVAGAACTVLGAGLSFASLGLTGIAIAVDVASVGISALVTSVAGLGTVVSKMAVDFNELVNSLNTMGGKTVSEIYDTLISYARDLLPDAGRSMLAFIQDGFEAGIFEVAPQMIDHIISGFGNQVAMRELDIYSIGYQMAEYYKIGMLDAFAINSPSVVAMETVDYIVAGYEIESDARSGDMYKAGDFLGKSYGKGLANTSKDAGKAVVTDTVNTVKRYSIQNKDSIYKSGEVLGIAFDEGVRDPTESYCENLPGKDLVNDTIDTADSVATERSSDAYNAGQKVGDPIGKGIWDRIIAWIKSAGENIRKFMSSPTDFVASGIQETISGTTSVFEEYGKEYEKIANKMDTSYFRTTYMTGIGYVDHHGKVVESARESTDALTTSIENETEALGGSGGGGGNSKATKSNTKAKKENEKANESKTKSINEETEALDEETEAVEDNEQAIRDQAEQIEVVTEKFKDYLRAYQFSDPMKSAKGLSKTMSKLWTTEDKTLSGVTKTYKKLSKSLSNSINTIKKVVKFDGSGKYLKTLSDNLYKNVDKIEKKVLKSGKTIMKVTGASTKVFYKVGNTVEKMTIRTTKNIKKLGKQFEAARNFLANFNDEIEHQESSEDFILNLRSIEKYFGATKFGKMADKAKNYLRGIVDQFSEVNNSMDILAKNIDGIQNVTSKNSKATAFVADSFLALAATLYDGSDAANEYATEHAKLLFLLENGLATQEEVDEHFQSYISRLKDTIVEYRKTIYDSLSGSMDIWSKFNKNLMDEGEDLITNIESQIAGYYNWGNMLMELSKRGFDSGIIKMLTDEGVSSFGKAAKLMSMADDELALFTIRYQQSQAVIETATDTALAAVANAQTRASLRAAAAQGDKTAQAQLKLSKKRKKELMEDAKAVADFQAQYNKLTAKEEKEYLKSLSKEERKVYKAQLKAAKKQQAQLKKAAKREETKRAEKERLKAIIDGIKSMSDYLKVTRDYNKDAKAMAEVNKKIAEGLKPIQGTFTGITFGVNDATNSIIAFGESLEATGEEGLTYFEEITKRIQKFREEIVDSIKSVDILTTSFERAAKVSIETIMSNGLSQLTANDDLNSAIEQLKGKGYNLNVLNKIKEMITSDRAQAIEYITTMLGANADQIDYINAEYDKLAEQANKIGDSTTRMMAGATSREVLDNNIKAAEKQLKEAEKVRDEAHKKVIKAEEDYSKLANQRDKAYLKYLDLKKRKEQLEAIKKTGKLTKAQKKELKELSGIMGKVSAAQVLWQGLAQKTGDARARVGDAMLEEAKAQELLNNRLADYNKAMEELTKYDTEHQKAVDKLTNDIKLRQWFNGTIDSINKFKSSLKSLSRSSGEWGFLRDMVTDFMKPFDKVKEVFDESGNFSVIKSMADLSAGMKPIEDGLISFSATIASFDPEDSFETKMKKMKDALVDYQNTLESSIRSSSDFFSMFSGFSDEDNPLTATNYLEYADSQLAALETWQENLKKLADKGLDKELLEKFASQGLGSYEQVNAWVNATEAQIGEYNKLWKDYNESVTSASETALAAIGAAWSSAGQSLQEMMIEAFGGNSERFKEMGYESSLMIITGVKDGLTNAMPEIISAVEQSTSSTAMASVLGKEVGTAINSGLTAAISSSVTDTVNAAIDKFKMAVDSVNLYVQETLNTDFTITVHVDTSEIDAAVARMNNAIYGINAQAGTTSQAVTSSQENQAAAALEPVDSSSPITNNITFNQTNTSPKALSQTEIYLDTKHQLQAMDNRLKLMNG